MQSGHLRCSDNREQEKVRSNSSLRPSLIKQVCWVAEASVYTFMFVMNAEIVHVQCYRGLYVKRGYTNTIFKKL